MTATTIPRRVSLETIARHEFPVSCDVWGHLRGAEDFAVADDFFRGEGMPPLAFTISDDGDVYAMRADTGAVSVMRFLPNTIEAVAVDEKNVYLLARRRELKGAGKMSGDDFGLNVFQSGISLYAGARTATCFWDVTRNPRMLLGLPLEYFDESCDIRDPAISAMEVVRVVLPENARYEIFSAKDGLRLHVAADGSTHKAVLTKEFDWKLETSRSALRPDHGVSLFMDRGKVRATGPEGYGITCTHDFPISVRRVATGTNGFALADRVPSFYGGRTIVESPPALYAARIITE